MAKPENKKQITLLLEPDQLTKLKAWSTNTLIPVGALIRRAIDETLETHKAEILKAGK
jgi:hypothetical protein